MQPACISSVALALTRDPIFRYGTCIHISSSVCMNNDNKNNLNIIIPAAINFFSIFCQNFIIFQHFKCWFFVLAGLMEN